MMELAKRYINRKWMTDHNDPSRTNALNNAIPAVVGQTLILAATEGMQEPALVEGVEVLERKVIPLLFRLVGVEG